MPNAREKLVSIREAAALSRRSEETVRRWVWSGKVSAKKIGNQLFVSRVDLVRVAPRRDGSGRVRAPQLPEAEPSHFDQQIAIREALFLERKIEIARLAATLVEDGQSIALDGGTTTLQIARFLDGFTNLTVVTNSIDAATVLCDRPGITILMPGGVLRGVTRSLVGPHAVEWLGNRWVDVAFLGATGVTLDQGATNSNPFEIEVQEAIVKHARRVIVVADASKIGRNGFLQSLPLPQIHDIITNQEADTGVVAQLRQRVNVLLA
jgi:DeoR/GlpR family transcriptional regulator of sugar metabolism